MRGDYPLALPGIGVAGQQSSTSLLPSCKREGRGEGVSRLSPRLHGKANDRQDTVKLLHDVSIGEAQHAVSFDIHEPVACGVVALLRLMAVAVEFDHQAQFPAQEIREVRPDRHLPTESHSQLRARQIPPQGPLGWRCVPTQLPRASRVAGFEFAHGTNVPGPCSRARPKSFQYGARFSAPTPAPSRLREGNKTQRLTSPPASGRGRGVGKAHQRERQRTVPQAQHQCRKTSWEREGVTPWHLPFLPQS